MAPARAALAGEHGGARMSRYQSVAVPYPSREAWLAKLPKWTCSFAFQPIVNVSTQKVTAYEALVRGPKNESADTVLDRIPRKELATFDEECRYAALALAKRLGLKQDLNLNLLPQGFRADRDCLASTLDMAIEHGFAPEQIVLEVTEGEVLGNQDRFTELVGIYRGLGMRMAIDDFGSGYSGLNVLADFQPDQIKLDKNLVRGIQGRGPRQAIVRAILQVCRDLGIELIAEGIESQEEFCWLREEGVEHFQGYLFAKPIFEQLPPAQFPTPCP